MAGVAVSTASAQSPQRVTKVAPDTAINADTVIITYQMIPGAIKALQAVVTKVSGTVAGNLYLDGTIDGINWEAADTATVIVPNVARTVKVWKLPATYYYSYRVRYITTGTQRSVLSFSYMRRPDD